MNLDADSMKHCFHCENTNTAWFVRLGYPGAWFTTILWTFAKNNVKMPTVFLLVSLVLALT